MSAISEFWDEQAKIHGPEPTATAPDVFYRDLEVRAVLSVMKDPKRVMDVGCGNGYSTLRIAKEHPLASFVGMDASQEMINKAPRAANVSYLCGTAQDLTGPAVFDHIFTIRCLINIESGRERWNAIDAMIDLLKPGGRLILVENTIEGLERLNRVRASVNLPPIEQKWHNRYFEHKALLSYLESQLKVIDVCNIGSPYYLISRVVYAALCRKQGVEPDYLNEINKIASQLPVMGDCSPNMIYVGVKR